MCSEKIVGEFLVLRAEVLEALREVRMEGQSKVPVYDVYQVKHEQDLIRGEPDLELSPKAPAKQHDAPERHLSADKSWIKKVTFCDEPTADFL